MNTCQIAEEAATDCVANAHHKNAVEYCTNRILSAIEEAGQRDEDHIESLYTHLRNLSRAAQAGEGCTCDNANGFHWGKCPLNLKPRAAQAGEPHE